MAKCSAHADSDPSLSLYFDPGGRVLLHCFGGCSAQEVMGSLGLTMSDLFEGGSIADRLPGGNDRWKNRKAEVRVEHHKLRMDIAAAMRERGEKLTPQQLREERESWVVVNDG